MAELEQRLLMLIDDEPAQTRLISTLASREGWRTVVAQDAETAIATLGTRQGMQLSAIVLDQWVPGDDTCNLITELNLTDVETCYKMFRAPLLKSIPLRSDDFAFEIEITAKISKRHCRIYEVPISYRGRAYSEGKKIRWHNTLSVFFTMFSVRVFH